MFRKVKPRSGFVFVELAIALPLLIMLMCTLANVGTNVRNVTVKVTRQFGGEEFKLTSERRMRVVPSNQTS